MKRSQSETAGKTIQSVETALSIFEAVQKDEPMSLVAITDAVDRSKSTVYHHLSTLCDAGYLERVDEGYQLSFKLLSLGGQVRERNRLYHLAKDYVDDLADQTGEQSRLIVEEAGVGVTIYQAVGKHGSVTKTHIGSSEDLYCTAAGKAFLAELPTEAVDAYIEDTELAGYTDQTLTHPDALRSELETIRSQGVAFDDEEYYQDIRCVASAIGSQSGELLGAISVSAPAERMDDDRFNRDVPNQIQNVVGVVEINSAYSDWTDALSE